MKTNVKRRIAYVFLFAILIISIFFLLIGTSLKEVVSGHELPIGEEELPPVQESDPSVLSIDEVSSPIKGRTSWANESRPLGFVIYLDDVSFSSTQVHLQNRMTEESLNKITFTRVDKSATPVLICASKDGAYGKSYFAFFFAGELASETVNEYQEGDTFEIAEGCILTCNEGSFCFDGAVKYIYDGEWGYWKTENEKDPEIIDYSTTGVPIDGVTNWGKDKEYVGIVLYNKGWTFEGGQVHLQVKPWMKTEKVTFTRGEITEKCALIVAGLDGNKNLSYCSYFFGGELKKSSLQAYDTVKIEGYFFFATKEGKYSYGKKVLEFIFDGEQWIDTSVNDQSLTYITYITEQKDDEQKDDGDRILFNLKTTTIFGTDDEVTDSLKQSILINGVSVSDLGSKADINYSFSKIVLSVEKSALELDDYDMIVIKKGAILKGDEATGLKLRDDETFRYSHTLNRTDLIPDHEYYGNLSNYAIIDNIEVAGDVSSSKIRFQRDSFFNLGVDIYNDRRRLRTGVGRDYRFRRYLRGDHRLVPYIQNGVFRQRPRIHHFFNRLLFTYSTYAFRIDFLP